MQATVKGNTEANSQALGDRSRPVRLLALGGVLGPPLFVAIVIVAWLTWL
jgi:hypothetical protein